MTLFLQTLKFTLCLVFSYWFLLIKRELITPATPYAPLHPHLSIPSASSHSQLCIYILPASVLGTGTSSSWTLGPVKSLLNYKGSPINVKKSCRPDLIFLLICPFCGSSWQSHALCHSVVKCIGFFRVWLQVAQGKNMFCKRSCIQHRYQTVTASRTPKRDCVWLNWEVKCFSTAQAL